FISMSHPKIEIVQQQWWLFSFTNDIRTKVYATYLDILPQDLASLLLGMVFGVQPPMSFNFLNSLKMAGVMHIIAASGMNITLVAAAVMSLTGSFLRRKMVMGIPLS
ncbi:MAG: ComEC/Rec2 family competence protein, partial [Peptococcaceae bacterium]|nr:ComEC/Rec2 family competence protein [Peptococcaceae bacterium]